MYNSKIPKTTGKQAKTPCMTGHSNMAVKILGILFIILSGGLLSTPVYAQEHGLGSTAACPLSKSGDTALCTFTSANLDGFGDAIQVVGAFTNSGPTLSTRIPAIGNNAEIIQVGGDTTCAVGAFAACLLNSPGAFVRFQVEIPVNPLEVVNGKISVQSVTQYIDQCNVTPSPSTCDTTTNDSEASAAIAVFEPSVSLTKTPDREFSKVGDTINYTFEITNNSSSQNPDLTPGDIPSLECTITDDIISSGLPTNEVVATGDTASFVVPYVVQPGDSNPLVNHATVTCSPIGFENEFTADAEALVTLVSPALILEKSCDTPVVNVGDLLQWTVIATNTGDTPLDITVTDPTLAGLSCTSGSDIPPNGTVECSASRTATLDDIPSVINQAHADAVLSPPAGIFLGNQLSADSNPAECIVNPLPPAIDIEKHTNGVDADFPGEAVVIQPGDTVTWEYIVTNIGQSVITTFTVTDDLLPGFGAGIIDCEGQGNVWNGALPPGGVVICTANDVAQNLNLGGANTEEECNGYGVRPVYNNIGSVVGFDEFGQGPVTDNDPSRYCSPPPPSIDIEKSTNGVDADNPGEAVVINPGDPVTWEYLVTNTGPTVITEFTVTDDLLPGDGAGIIDCEGQGNVWSGALPPGGTVLCTALGVAEDLNVSGSNTEEECDQYGIRPVYNNTGHVVGVDEFQIPTNEDTDPSRYCNPPRPDFTINKECTPDPVNAGELITWNIFLENTGDVPLDIHVIDTTAEIDETVTVPPLPADNTETITASRIVLESEIGTTIVNTATATADVPGFPTLERTSNTAECEVPPEVELLCRTPGFWGTHACGDSPPVGVPYYGDGSDCEKKNSQNLTQQVLDAINADGQLYICGEPINNTIVGSEESALEAICNSPGNDEEDNKDLILARHLTVMAINCEISGANEDCAGVPYLNELFTECNNLCAGLPSTKTFEECGGAVDAFNNGRLEGYYCSEDIGQYEGWARTPVPGPAGSSQGCSDATASELNIFD